MVSCDFLVRPNLLQVLVNGEDFNKIPVKKARLLLESIGKEGIFITA